MANAHQIRLPGEGSKRLVAKRLKAATRKAHSRQR